MAAFGDIPLNSCPANLMEAHQQSAESRRLAQSKVDPSALPPAPVPLQLLMGQYYQNYQYTKKLWADYQSSHNAKDQETAIYEKALLLRTYNRSCNIQKSAPGGGNGEFCQLVRQLTDEFQEIPDGPPSSAVPNTQGPQVPSLPHPTSAGIATANPTQPQPNPSTVQTRGPAPRTSATDASSIFPAGTQLMVTLTDTVDFSAAGQTFRGELVRAVQYGTQVLVPQGSEVELQVSVPETSANGNIVTVSLGVVSVTVDGKRIPVSTQPMMRRFPTTGVRNPGANQIAAKNMLTFIVRAK
jgi:hypothetical protein